MLVLGIETSCDDTGIALLQIVKRSFSDAFPFPKIQILGEAISSQIKVHAPFGGVVPTLASREHVKNIGVLLQKVLQEAKDKKKVIKKEILEEIDLIAVTVGPGLIPALLVGVSFAKALAYRLKRPIIGVNHLEAHLYSPFVDQRLLEKRPSFPAIGLIVSGGHTELLLIKSLGNYQALGETLDDAAGEAFDKVGRLLGLGYPGGPAIEKAARKGNAACFNFPRPMINSGDYNFSFAGLKTAVFYKARDIKEKKGKGLAKKIRADMAASFQAAVIDVLVKKTLQAAQDFKAKSVILGGGVSANQRLREELRKKIGKANQKLSLFLPSPKYTGDNGAMVALTGFANYSRGKRDSWKNLEVDPNLQISKV